DVYKRQFKRLIDNKIVYLESTVLALKDKNGGLFGYILKTDDISETGKSQTRLYLQYKISRILLESKDMQQSLQDVLKTICKNMMWDQGEIFIVDRQNGYLKYDIKWSLLEEDGDDDIKRSNKLQSETSLKNVIFPIEGRDKKIGSVTFISRVLYNFDEDLKHTIEIICKLISIFIERQESEENYKKYAELLVKKNKELEEFAYVASHDLQQPLRMITGFSQLIEERLSDKLNNEDKEIIGHISQSVKRMQDLIDDLLSYSRLTTNTRPFTFVKLKDIIEMAKSNLQSQIDSTGTTFEFDSNLDLIEIYCDKMQMVQLFQNLFDNSIKYRQTDIAPTISISLRKTADKITISVADNGIGFDISQVERIFKIFQRLHSDDKYPGTGIGLSICKKIIERHDGMIWVESEVGSGTTFYISLNTYPKK
ncbi:MAG: ATP-binding protein, partial [Thermodesulfovibrionales bacterium]|nr:ATP-binding protein [Thermodesulfovibrionales bacterium]